MCFLCDGGTEGELTTTLRERIDRFGFTMMGVGDDVNSWVYTIGLLENFGHPELVVTTLAMESAAGLFNGLVDRIWAGESFSPLSPDTALEVGPAIRFSSVHPTQWANGRFAMWTNYYGERSFLPAQPEAVQVLWPNDAGMFPPDRDFCHDHNHCQPLLAFPVASNVNTRSDRSRKHRRK